MLALARDQDAKLGAPARRSGPLPTLIPGIKPLEPQSGPILPPETHGHLLLRYASCVLMLPCDLMLLLCVVFPVRYLMRFRNGLGC